MQWCGTNIAIRHLTVAVEPYPSPLHPETNKFNRNVMTITTEDKGASRIWLRTAQAFAWRLIACPFNSSAVNSGGVTALSGVAVQLFNDVKTTLDELWFPLDALLNEREMWGPGSGVTEDVGAVPTGKQSVRSTALPWRERHYDLPKRLELLFPGLSVSSVRHYTNWVIPNPCSVVSREINEVRGGGYAPELPCHPWSKRGVEV